MTPQAYRVRYTPELPAGLRSQSVLTAEVECGLDEIPVHLPAGSYILYVDGLTADRAVHWTRWPVAFRPGFVDPSTGRVAK